MYTDEDLNFAVKRGVFTNSSVEDFRSLVSELKNSPSVDEENFRLIGGFNDIFVVIACSLLLFSSLWVLESANDGFGYVVFSALSWCLAEFFVLKRRMSLPAIFLLLTFVGGVFASFLSFISSGSTELAFTVASAASTAAAYVHWLRFRVPITMAAGTAAGITLLVFSTLQIFPDGKDWVHLLLFICGSATFVFAMYWDSSDTERTTRRSDVAFWLHLLSAPLIIHPVFYSLGILSGNEGRGSLAIVVALYLLMTSISIVVDRRAFMVSSLVYVIYALSSLLKTVGGIGDGIALTGVFIGGALLLLSAFWYRARAFLVGMLPDPVKGYIPKIVVR